MRAPGIGRYAVAPRRGIAADMVFEIEDHDIVDPMELEPACRREPADPPADNGDFAGGSADGGAEFAFAQEVTDGRRGADDLAGDRALWRAALAEKGEAGQRGRPLYEFSSLHYCSKKLFHSCSK